MSELSEIINKRISKTGSMRFDTFMGLALYHPEHGYYMRKEATPFGQTGDFITAPTLSNHFSECFANQIASIVSQQNWTSFRIVEYGAGSGMLAHGLLNALTQRSLPPLGYHIIEISPALQAVQQKTLAPYREDLELSWHYPSPPKMEEPVIVIANELFDAFPVVRFEVDSNQQVHHLGVGLDGNQLTNKQMLADEELKQAFNRLCDRLPNFPFSPGYRSEINLSLESWFSELNNWFQRGIVFCIDYGYPSQEYYHPDRSTGTLMAHHDHKAHSNVLANPGLQDITAHVDFTAVVHAAEKFSFAPVGFCPQSAFLISNGLAELPNIDPATLKYLTSPNLMGESFKVLACAKAIETDLPISGFQLVDHLYRID